MHYRQHVLHYADLPKGSCFQKLAILIVPPSNAEPRPACFALSDLFNASPHLATYIRDLTVTFNNPDPATSIGISVLEKLSSIVSLRIDRHLCTELSWSFGSIGDAKVPSLFVPFPLVVLQNRLSDDLNCIIAVALCSRSPGSLLRILRLRLCLPHSPPR